MTRIVLRGAALAGGTTALALAAPGVEAQPARPPAPAFEIAAGPQYGLQDPERPVTPGWIVSSGFELDGRTFVVEGSWHRDMYVRHRDMGFDGVARETHRGRYLTLAAGVRAGERGGRVAPFYQVLAGGFAVRFRTDYQWPESLDVETANAECGGYVGGRLVLPCLYVPYPAFDEQRSAGFVMQPGMGMDVNLRPGFALRLAADLPIFADGDHVALRPRLSARAVVAFGR